MSFNRTLLSVAVGFLGLAEVSSEVCGEALAEEPPLVASVTIDGNVNELTLGRPANVGIAGTVHEVQVTLKPTRRFSKLGVEFDYPTDFKYEADISEKRLSWTLKGEDVELEILCFGEEMEVSRLADLIVDAFQALPDTVIRPRSVGGDATLEVADIKLIGERRTVDCPWGATKIELYELPMANTRSLRVVLKVMWDGDLATEEEYLVRSLLKESMRIKELGIDELKSIRDQLPQPAASEKQ